MQSEGEVQSEGELKTYKGTFYLDFQKNSVGSSREPENKKNICPCWATVVPAKANHPFKGLLTISSHTNKEDLLLFFFYYQNGSIAATFSLIYCKLHCTLTTSSQTRVSSSSSSSSSSWALCFPGTLKCMRYLIRSLFIFIVLQVLKSWKDSFKALGNIWAATRDFQQCGILTSVYSDHPVHPPFKLRKLWLMLSQ